MGLNNLQNYHIKKLNLYALNNIKYYKQILENKKNKEERLIYSP